MSIVSLLNKLPASFFLIDAEDRISYVNKLPAGLNSVDDPQSLLGKKIRDVLAPMVFEGAGLGCALGEARQNEKQIQLKGVHLAKTANNRIYWDLRLQPLGEEEKGSLILQITEDDRDQKNQENLESYRQFTEDVLRSLGSGLVVVDNQGQVIISNEMAAQILEYSVEELNKKSLSLVLGENVAEDVLAGKYDNKDFEKGQFEVLRQLQSGREIYLGYSVASLFDKHGNQTGKIVHFKDVTDLKQMKQRIAHQEKMAAVGSLAGGVAHEFNNLIGGMMGYAQLARATRESRDLEKCMEVVLDSSKRAKEIVTSLLTFARRPEGLVERVRLVDLIDQTLVLLERSLIKQNIQIQKKYRFQEWLETDGSKLQVVILNLLTNARDAMGEGGTLTIRTEKNKGSVLFTISDTGHGIPKENQYRIFEPFFTTKGAIGCSSVPGTGLGLSVSYGIIQSLRGDIKAESQPGQGTHFTVYLPQKKEDQVNTEALVESFPKATGMIDSEQQTLYTVLALDPDPIVREGLGKSLKRLGCKVVLSENWEQAVEEACYTNFDLVLHAESVGTSANDNRNRRIFQVENPRARFIPCLPSGRNGVDASQNIFLRKPYKHEDVMSVLNRVSKEKAEKG